MERVHILKATGGKQVGGGVASPGAAARLGVKRTDIDRQDTQTRALP